MPSSQNDALVLDWSRRLAAHWGLPEAELRQVQNVPDIASIPAQNVILLGHGFRSSGWRRQKQKVLHEYLHMRGMDHSDASRRIGYYSDPNRDRYARQTLTEVEYEMARRSRSHKNPGYLAGYQSNADAGLQGYLARAGRAGNPKTGAEPRTCTACGKRFASMTALFRHWDKIHPEQALWRQAWENPMFPRMAGMVAPAYGPAQSLITGIYSNPPHLRKRRRRRNPGLMDNKWLLIGGAVIAYLWWQQSLKPASA